MDSELFFNEQVGQYPAQAIQACRSCTHRLECAQYALGFYNLDGLWGGLTPQQRRELRHEHGLVGKPIELWLEPRRHSTTAGET